MVDPSLFSDEAEHTLYRVLQETRVSALGRIEQQDFLEALTVIGGLKWAVDSFFDAVMVMAEDPAVKTNRLALLTVIQHLFLRVADFSRLTASGQS